MDPIWLSLAFLLGFLVRLINLPPMVGYLIAGFVLNYFGVQVGPFINVVSDLGVTLLLFTIGLKLNIKTLLRKEVWAGSMIHMALTTLSFFLVLLLLSSTGFDTFNGFSSKLALVIAFALSFSSTIFAVKILEDRGEMTSPHGILSIGILVVQDIIAVLFIVFAVGKTPNLWALGLPVLLLVLRPIFFYILNRIGHGELLILFGFFLALVAGYQGFQLVDLKGDLGALVIGVLVANHERSKELADSLLNFKDIFLVGFFLSIGLMGLPTLETFIIAVIMTLVINIKVVLYFFVMVGFKLRARTSFFTSLTLANYSEFGLIVASFAVAAGMINSNWLVVIAIALSITFIISSVLNSKAYDLYYRFKEPIHRFEAPETAVSVESISIGDAQILVFGLGRLGSSVYGNLQSNYGSKVLGLDYNLEVVEQMRSNGCHVMKGDGTDIEFWEEVMSDMAATSQLKAVVLCMNEHNSILNAVNRLNTVKFKGIIATTSHFKDEMEELKELNIKSVYDIYAEAGYGFADHVEELIGTFEEKT